MSTDAKAFRTVKHGLSDIDAYCRQCDWTSHFGNQSNVKEQAQNHAKKTLHTVDLYRETWTEYTSHVKDPTPSNKLKEEV